MPVNQTIKTLVHAADTTIRTSDDYTIEHESNMYGVSGILFTTILDVNHQYLLPYSQVVLIELIYTDEEEPDPEL